MSTWWSYSKIKKTREILVWHKLVKAYSLEHNAHPHKKEPLATAHKEKGNGEMHFGVSAPVENLLCACTNVHPHRMNICRGIHKTSNKHKDNKKGLRHLNKYIIYYVGYIKDLWFHAMSLYINKWKKSTWKSTSWIKLLRGIYCFMWTIALDNCTGIYIFVKDVMFSFRSLLNGNTSYGHKRVFWQCVLSTDTLSEGRVETSF